MATGLTPDPLVDLLRAIGRLLINAGEATVGGSIDRLATAREEARGIDERQQIVREILALYGGMGSFQDLVLQDSQGVMPEQDELERLKAALFSEARRELR